MEAQIQEGYRNTSGGGAERLFLALAARIRCGQLSILLPNGVERVFRGDRPGPNAELRVYRPRFFRRMFSGGDLAFAEAYMDGDCDTPNLTAVLELGALNEQALAHALTGQRWVRLVQRMFHLLRPNSARGAKRNIAQHYDLGNDFYAAWLDPSMTYSGAVFEAPDEALETSQANKYRRMAALAGIEPGHHVLEIGCGWGGFSAWAARELGCRVTAITISRQQFDFAARRIQREGLSDRVHLRLQDYRDLTGQFDRAVSIEMFEAVGEKYWPLFFQHLRDRLIVGGRAALQVITIADEFFPSYRRDIDFIQRYVFPGGMLPSLEVLRRETRAAGLSWAAEQGYGEHYARTLVAWNRRFEEAWPRIAQQGFDERFRRMWRYYLAYCEAGFRIDRIDVVQVALAKA